MVKYFHNLTSSRYLVETMSQTDAYPLTSHFDLVIETLLSKALSVVSLSERVSKTENKNIVSSEWWEET